MYKECLTSELAAKPFTKEHLLFPLLSLLDTESQYCFDFV